MDIPMGIPRKLPMGIPMDIPMGIPRGGTYNEIGTIFRRGAGRSLALPLSLRHFDVSIGSKHSFEATEASRDIEVIEKSSSSCRNIVNK